VEEMTTVELMVPMFFLLTGLSSNVEKTSQWVSLTTLFHVDLKVTVTTTRRRKGLLFEVSHKKNRGGSTGISA
jgi:hypothetical protein